MLQKEGCGSEQSSLLTQKAAKTLAGGKRGPVEFLPMEILKEHLTDSPQSGREGVREGFLS